MRPYEPPPPGFYYDPKASPLKSTGRPHNAQPFASTEARFRTEPDNGLGPGQYQIEKARSQPVGGHIGLS
jgi:hypothetical protein